MKFKKCELCGEEKTLRQFSKRITDICTQCMMASEERIKARKAKSNRILSPIAIETPVAIETPEYTIPAITTQVITPDSNTKSVKAPLKENKPTPRSLGYKVATKAPFKSRVKGGSTTYAGMSDDEKRAILKAEYRERKIKANREKREKSS